MGLNENEDDIHQTPPVIIWMAWASLSSSVSSVLLNVLLLCVRPVVLLGLNESEDAIHQNPRSSSGWIRLFLLFCLTCHALPSPIFSPRCVSSFSLSFSCFLFLLRAFSNSPTPMVKVWGTWHWNGGTFEYLPRLYEKTPEDFKRPRGLLKFENRIDNL